MSSLLQNGGARLIAEYGNIDFDEIVVLPPFVAALCSALMRMRFHERSVQHEVRCCTEKFSRVNGDVLLHIHCERNVYKEVASLLNEEDHPHPTASKTSSTATPTTLAPSQLTPRTLNLQEPSTSLSLERLNRD